MEGGRGRTMRWRLGLGLDITHKASSSNKFDLQSLTSLLTNEGDRHAFIKGRDGSPFPGALLSCRVTDLLHQRFPICVL